MQMWETLEQAVGQTIEAQTRDGSVRRGKLTSIRWEDVDWNGTPLRCPCELQLNAEIGDLLSWRQLSRVRVVL
jgi:hypothetical protein